MDDRLWRNSEVSECGSAHPVVDVHRTGPTHVRNVEIDPKRDCFALICWPKCRRSAGPSYAVYRCGTPTQMPAYSL